MVKNKTKQQQNLTKFKIKNLKKCETKWDR